MSNFFNLKKIESLKRDTCSSMKILTKILAFTLVITVSNALPRRNGEFHLKIYPNKLKISLKEDEKKI